MRTKCLRELANRSTLRTFKNKIKLSPVLNISVRTYTATMDSKSPTEPSPPLRAQVKKENEEEIKVRYNFKHFLDIDGNFRWKTIIVFRLRLIGNRPVSSRLVIGDGGVVFLNSIFYLRRLARAPQRLSRGYAE